jgi:type II secretory ATPase GspE/PulE/Tfp pilus assembly ATPase PilB-like protein
VPLEPYLVNCWNCLSDFDALTAVWCSCDTKNPTKLCPYCFRCFCEASEKYKQEFWRSAPLQLQEEIQTLSGSKDRLGDVLVRMKRIQIPQLLEALREQKRTGQRLGEILTGKGLITPDDVAAALRTQGVNPLTDTQGVAYAAAPVWEHSPPEAIVEYILNLAARKGASDVTIEPTEEEISLKYRIDGFQFRLDSIPKSFQAAVTTQLLSVLNLDDQARSRPVSSRTTARFGEAEYDVVAQTLPTSHGLGVSVKLINRATFIKDFATLGIEIEDRVRLMEELRGPFGLVLVTAPVFNGAHTSLYSIMSFLVQNQRDVVSLESPVQWSIEGARQVAVEPARTEETLRSVIAIRPEVVVLFGVPDRGTAVLACHLASSILVVAAIPGRGALAGVSAMLEMGVSPQALGSSIAAVTSQRLVRLICRICRQPAPAPAAQTLGLHGIGAEEAAGLRFHRGKGCPTCNSVGYRGRRAIFEVLSGSPEVRHAVQAQRSPQDIEALSVASGMTPLRTRCLDLVRSGVTSFDEFAKQRF